MDRSTEKYLDKLLGELKEDELNSDFLAIALVNYVVSKCGKQEGDDILCETLVSVSSMLSQEDKLWCIEHIDRFVQKDT